MQPIRYATMADVESISRLHATTWQEAYRGLMPEDYLRQISYERWLPVFTEAINTRSHTLAVYPHKQGIGGIGGCVTFGPPREERKAGWAEITAIYVLPPLWRLGLGRHLLLFALEELRLQGYRNCYLWVLKGNQRACNFYEKMGFSLSCDEKFFDHDGHTLHELRYEIQL